MSEPTPPVKVWSHHEVASWVKAQTDAGTLKPCAHLKVISIDQASQQVAFTPVCGKRSFDWRPQQFTRRQELDTLLNMLHTKPISCPATCVNYYSRRRARLVGMSRWLWAACRGLVVGPTEWFAKLPWQTQLGLVVVLILLVARPLVPQMINLLNAYHGR